MDRHHNDLGFDIVRATEAAALGAGRWMGLGNPALADNAAASAMHSVLTNLNIDGHIVVGEDTKLGDEAPLAIAQQVGTGNGPAMDVVLDPIDGRTLLAQGRLGAISVAAIAPRGSMWSPPPEVAYMDKLVVSPGAASALVTECMDAPVAWTLALVARATQKEVRDLVVFVLERARHNVLIDEIRAAGARVMLRSDGDIAGAVMASSRAGVDILMGIGGAAEGIIAACAVRALGGAMLGRLWMRNERERAAIEAAGLDPAQILTCDELVKSNRIFFAATGITDSPLLAGVSYNGSRAESESLLLRGETGTRRLIHAEHYLGSMTPHH